MNIKKIIGSVIGVIVLALSCSTFAMSTYTFDNGMRKGIEYYNNGMYYEARDEFQWFCDYNWGDLNSGQQEYALDYLDGTKAKITELENSYDTYYIEQPMFGSSYTYYFGTDIPTYSSVTGAPFIRVDHLDNGAEAYVYEYAGYSINAYQQRLSNNGWSLLYGDDASTPGIIESAFYKGSDFVIVMGSFDSNEVYVCYYID